MPAKIDLTGKKIGSLMVTGFAGNRRNTRGISERMWSCLCDCGERLELQSSCFSNRKAKGCLKCEINALKKDFEGKVFKSSVSGNFVVDKYVSSTEVHVTFLSTGYITQAQLKEVRQGKVKDLLHPSVCGVGYFGTGRHSGSTEDDLKNSPAYEVWRGIIRRCYDKNCNSYGLYEGVRVCEEWHNFQNFAEWFYSQEHHDKGFAVDKDLRIFGNKIYSPETCSLVPPAVNSLFTGSSERLKPRELPKGVHFCKEKGLYITQIHKGEFTKSGNKKQTYLGQFGDKKLAILAYKTAKEEHVKDVAELYKDVIHPDVYNNLMDYEVDVKNWIKE